MKGTLIDNAFCACGNDIDKYIAEVTRAKYDHIPDSLTTDDHASPWRDDSGNDSNDCSAANNSIVSEMVYSRQNCAEVFAFDWSALDETRLGQLQNKRRLSRSLPVP